MIPRHRLLNAAVALALGVVLSVLTMVVPLLDMGAAGPGVRIAAEHDGSTGAVDHDHLTCIQHSASGWAAAVAIEPPADFTRSAVAPAPSHARVVYRLPVHLPRSRGPPSA